MASVGGQSAYAVRLCTIYFRRRFRSHVQKTEIVAVQRVWYQQKYSFSCPNFFLRIILVLC